jgi:hypothetical protein
VRIESLILVNDSPVQLHSSCSCFLRLGGRFGNPPRLRLALGENLHFICNLISVNPARSPHALRVLERSPDANGKFHDIHPDT